MAAGRKVGLEKLSLEDMRSVEPRIGEEVFGVLGVERSVRSRTSYGGTAPANVRKQARRWLARLRKEGKAPAPPRVGDRGTQEGPNQRDADREVSLP
jgi:argininosuccinate lyase